MKHLAHRTMRGAAAATVLFLLVALAGAALADAVICSTRVYGDAVLVGVRNTGSAAVSGRVVVQAVVAGQASVSSAAFTVLPRKSAVVPVSFGGAVQSVSSVGLSSGDTLGATDDPTPF